MNIGTLTVLLGVNTAGLSRAAVNMRRFETMMVGSGRRMTAMFANMGAKMGLMGSMLTQYTALPAGLLAGASLKQFSDFEFELSKITGLVGVSASQVRDWGNNVLQYSSRFGQSAKELAGSMYYITSASLRGTDALNALLYSSAAATTGLSNSITIADSVTSAMNAYGEASMNAAHATDILIAGIRESKTAPEGFVRNIGKIFPIAAQFGVSYNDVAAGVAALTRTGTPVAQAATYLRRFFFTMIQEPKQAIPILAKLGMSFQDVRYVLKEGGLMNLLTMFNDRLDGNIVAFKKLFPNVRAVLPVLDILGPNLDKNTESFKRMQFTAGTLLVALEASKDTLKVRFGQALESTKNNMIRFGDVLKNAVIPILGKVNTLMARLANWFNNLTQAQKQNILKWTGITLVVGPLVFIFGQLLTLIGGLSASILTLVARLMLLSSSIVKSTIALFTTSLVTSLKSVGTAIWALSKKVVLLLVEFAGAIAIVAVVLAIAAAVTLVSTNWESWKASFPRILDQLKVQALEFLSWLNEHMSPIIEHIGTFMAKAMGIFFMSPLLKRAMQKNVNDTSHFYKSMAEDQIKAIERIQAKIDDPTQYGKGALKFKEVYTQSIDKIKTKFNDFLFGLPDLVKGIQPTLPDLLPNDYIKKQMQNAFMEADDYVKKKVEFPTMQKFFPMSFRTQGADLESTHSKLIQLGLDLSRLKEQSGIIPGLFDIQQRKSDLIGEFMNHLDTLSLMDLKLIDDTDLERIKKYVELFNLLTNSVKEITNKFKMFRNVFKDMVSGITSIFTDFISGTQKGMKQFFKAIGNFMKQLIAKLIAAAIVAAILAVLFSIFMPKVGSSLLNLKNGFNFIKAFGTLFGLASGLGGIKMAKGGVVGPGYPNDSFSARLSSREAILPLDSLFARNLFKNNSGMEGKVVFEIGVDKLVGVLQYDDKVKSNY